MIILFIVAQLADMLTMRSGNEYNPLVLALGPWAYAAKVALIIVSIAIARFQPRRVVRNGLLGFGTVAGLIGVWSNT
jgi:hypothetical protein